MANPKLWASPLSRRRVNLTREMGKDLIPDIGEKNTRLQQRQALLFHGADEKMKGKEERDYSKQVVGVTSLRG